jgi:hypothetical protein
MKPNCLSLVALAVVALLALNTQAADYTVRDWKIAVSVVPDAPAITLGEPTWLSFKVENLSGEDLQIIVGGDYRNEYGRPNSFKIQVTDEQGRTAPQPGVRFEGGGLIGPRPLPAGSNYIFRLFVPDWARFGWPSTYTFACARALKLLQPRADHSWSNAPEVVVSVTTRLTVKPRDDARLGEVIHDLGEKLLNTHENSEARKALASIHDDRVLPIWLKSQERKTYDARFSALNALADYPAPQAVEALQRAVDLKGEDFPNCCTTAEVAESLARNIRVVAVHSLAKNKNPDGRKFLLERRRSSDDELRLIVVPMLGAEKTAESTVFLEEMKNDTNKLVRGEAERYLRERGAPKPFP